MKYTRKTQVILTKNPWVKTKYSIYIMHNMVTPWSNHISEFNKLAWSKSKRGIQNSELDNISYIQKNNPAVTNHEGRVRTQRFHVCLYLYFYIALQSMYVAEGKVWHMKSVRKYSYVHGSRFMYTYIFEGFRSWLPLYAASHELMTTVWMVKERMRKSFSTLTVVGFEFPQFQFPPSSNPTSPEIWQKATRTSHTPSHTYPYIHVERHEKREYHQRDRDCLRD
jgi:hypothetical protein